MNNNLFKNTMEKKFSIKNLKLLNTILLIIITMLSLLTFVSSIYDYTLGMKSDSYPFLLKINKITGKACRVENVSEFIFYGKKAVCMEVEKEK